MSIKILPEEIQNQIAAGEVVERPASIIKELIENAIDAGANFIQVKIDAGGKERIEVIDNGKGMSEEDAKKSTLRHATSKIETIDDIFSIQSYGFRGEALAAISSVSVFTLITKQEKDSEGTKIITHPGKEKEILAVGANTGTSILIESLFAPTPARLQYLKNDETEYRECLKVFQQFALIRPDVHFILSKNGNVTFDLTSVSDEKERFLQLQKKTTKECFSIKNNDSLPNGISRVQYIGSGPGHFQSYRKHQHIYVNGRPVEDYQLAFAVREAYVQSCGIEKHLHPFFLLQIEIDPILVDVNVHPRKKEVKFSDPREVFSSVKRTIIEGLNADLNNEKSSPPVKINSNPKEQSSPQRSFSINTNVSTHSRAGITSFNKFISQKPSFHHQHKEINSDIPTDQYTETASSPSISSKSKLQVISQLQNKYIMAQSEQGIFLFDQHALHERIRFEHLRKQFKNHTVQIQSLLIPTTIILPEESISILKEHTPLLKELHIQVIFPNTDTVEIHSIPLLLKDENPKEIIEDTIQFIEDDKIGESNYEKFLRKKLEYRSCRGSVFFGDKMEIPEMQLLLDQFLEIDWNILCPHGRPNHVQWSFDEIDKMFHR